jgi:hypothetical protein
MGWNSLKKKTTTIELTLVQIIMSTFSCMKIMNVYLDSQ